MSDGIRDFGGDISGYGFAPSTPAPQGEMEDKYLEACDHYLDGFYSLAIQYRIPAQDAAEWAKHIRNACLGLNKLVARERESRKQAEAERGHLRGDLYEDRELVTGDNFAEMQQRAERAEEALGDITRVASGEDQVSDDDTGGLAWIYHRAKRALSKPVQEPAE